MAADGRRGSAAEERISIDFSKERWREVKKNARRWWDHELERPLVQVTVTGYDPGVPAPELPYQRFTGCYGAEVPAAAIIERWEYRLAGQKYLADAFPCIWPNFGAGVAAAFLGAILHVSPEARTIWFHHEREREISTISFKESCDPRNPWLVRVKDIYRAAISRWQGLVQVGMTDLGGNLDILSTFRPGEGLLLDLYDQPGEVERLVWEEHDAWWRYYDELNAILQPVNPGYTCWTPFFSETPYYMLQCDFCYMIGPEMFDRFVKPELAATCKRLHHAFYHLDGVGQLPHLDSLLEIDELAGVQWIMGAGQPGAEHWLDVYQRIHEAGKLIQLVPGESQYDYRVLDVVADHLGTAAGIGMIVSVPREREEEARRFLEDYGIEP